MDYLMIKMGLTREDHGSHNGFTSIENFPENLGGVGKFVYFCPRIIKLIRTNNCQFHKLQKYEAFNDFDVVFRKYEFVRANPGK